MKMNTNYPDKNTAMKLLDEGVALNPGRWREHCVIAANAAEKIADKCGLDSERAFVNSLLHDIGRRVGVCNIRHIIEGYDYMTALGFDGVARICLTHSFMTKDINEYLGKMDISKVQTEFIENYLASVQYDDYDRLGQLCDYVSHPDGVCMLEKRMVDVAMRYGFNDLTLKKWQKAFETKEHFDKLANCDIYTLILQ